MQQGSGVVPIKASLLRPAPPTNGTTYVRVLGGDHMGRTGMVATMVANDAIVELGGVGSVLIPLALLTKCNER